MTATIAPETDTRGHGANTSGDPEVHPAIQELFDNIASCDRGHHWVLEPGEPLYEEIPARRTHPREGCPAEVGSVVRLIELWAADGTVLPLPAGGIKSHLKPADRKWFSDGNLAIARTKQGHLAINRGIYVVTGANDDELELTLAETWVHDMAADDTLRPKWATRTNVDVRGMCVTYSRLDGDVEYERFVRLRGNTVRNRCTVLSSDGSPETMRKVAAQLVALADEIESAVA